MGMREMNPHTNTTAESRYRGKETSKHETSAKLTERCEDAEASGEKYAHSAVSAALL
jgi:hypothetical protein